MAEEEKPSKREAEQRHHDYYVGTEQGGTLKPEDRAQLDLAKQREAAGKVKPLTPTEPARDPISGNVPGIPEAGTLSQTTGKVESVGPINPVVRK